MSDLTVPDEFGEWPFEARQFVLAEANTAIELREEICGLVGLPTKDWSSDAASQFTKAEMAMLVMALGGPDGGGSA